MDETISDRDTGSEASATWIESGTALGTGYTAVYTVSHRLIGGAVAFDPEGFPYYLINSTGTSNVANRNLNIAIRLLFTSAFDTGLVGCDGVDFNSNADTDSYSSGGNPTTGDNGDVATVNVNADFEVDSNSIINGDVRVTGALTMASNAVILRDAYANGAISGLANPGYIGQDAYSNGTISNDSYVNGTSHPNQSQPVVKFEDCDPLDVDSLFTAEATPIASSNDNGDLNNMTGNSYNNVTDDADPMGTASQSKDYYFDDFFLGSNADIALQGDVTFYVDGDFELSSNAFIAFGANATLTIYVTGTFTLSSNTSINSGGIPADFQVYSSAENTDQVEPAKINMNSNSGFYGVIYAPKANVVSSSNNEISGAMRGKWQSYP